MTHKNSHGVYGFRFSEPDRLSLCHLFAVGHEIVTDSSYHWNGMSRTDGPLLLFQYTVEGHGMFETDLETHRIGPGRAFLTEIPGSHRYYHPGDSVPWEFYFLLFRPKSLLPLWEDIKSKLGAAPAIVPGSRPIRILRDIAREAHSGRISDPYMASSLLHQFMMELGRLSLGGPRDTVEWPAAIRDSVQFIDTHYSSMIGQEQLAGQMGLSKFHLLRTFSKYVGLTPNEYLNRTRIERAVELLGTTDWSIETIASQVGYSSGSYFIKVFQKMTGQTPGSFRSESGGLNYSRLFF
ncbi:AraC family transcriptional regulator [Paenibacillus helianthi]|uniref:AraC family transcriptional regulator n=1 Tax=Paenibacillus helianthi TaxID=1349432 RepID=A0ABX3EQE4_9BACL|nr:MULTISPECIES: helix-turn-helix domain-containing protein [Paenibacillus]OKP85369.1 AraC family transcriptional regulator [Paenibacillus helianthi]OKP85685.1 AraC family transcriptional regulator [Paenibacillus sp. P32E]